MYTYAGIGSRQTPGDVLRFMVAFGFDAANKGYRLRTGGAPGADDAFLAGHLAARQDNYDLHLPWHGFNGKTNGLPASIDMEARAAAIARHNHPHWEALSQGARRLHTRNAFVALGSNLNTPVDFVVCWTKGAGGKGGTGMALRILAPLCVPVWDLGDAALLEAWRQGVRPNPSTGFRTT